MAVNRKLVARGVARHQRGQRKKYHKFKVGVNRIRILSYLHLCTEFDVFAGRCDPDDVGVEYELFYVDVDRLWMGSVFKNALPNEEECPLWQDYWAKHRKDSKTARDYRPRPMFVINAIDMEEPQKGVQVMQLSQALFLGERTTQGKKVGLGVYDYYNGFDPKKHSEEEEGFDEEEEGGVQSALPTNKIATYGDAMLGLNGRDLFIHMKKGQAFGKEIVQPNNDREKGAVTIRPAENCDAIDKHFLKGVKDLWDIPQYYPGYVSGGKESMLWKEAQDFTDLHTPKTDEKEEEKSEASNKYEDEEVVSEEEEVTSEEQTEVGEEGSEEPETEAADPSPPKKKVTRKRKKKTKKTAKKPKQPDRITKGAKVVCIDKMNEDNTRVLPEKDWVRFIGIFEKYDTASSGETEMWCDLRPELQEEEDVKALVEGACGDKDAASARFDQDCVTLYEE